MRATLALLTLLCTPLAFAAAPTRATLPTPAPDFNNDGTADTSCTQPTGTIATVCTAPYASPTSGAANYTNPDNAIGNNPGTDATVVHTTSTTTTQSWTFPAADLASFTGTLKVTHEQDPESGDCTGVLPWTPPYACGTHTISYYYDGVLQLSTTSTPGAAATTWTVNLSNIDLSLVRIDASFSTVGTIDSGSIGAQVSEIYADCSKTSIQAAVDAVEAGDPGYEPPGIIAIDNGLLATATTVSLGFHDGNGNGTPNECEDHVWLVPDTHASLPAKGTRAGAGDAANMFKLDFDAGVQTSDRVIFIDSAAQYWWIRGADITYDGVSPGLSAMVECERSGLTRPSSIIFEQVYAHGPSVGRTGRAFFFDCDDSAIVDSHIDGIFNGSADAQAILGYCGDGVLIRNNFLEASSENILLGGGDPGADCQSLDWTIQQNVITKRQAWQQDRDGDLVSDEVGADGDSTSDADNDGTVNSSDPHFTAAWDGTTRNPKNLIEIKNGQRVLIEGNWLFGNDMAGQDGTAILIKPTCQCGDSGPTDIGGCDRSTFGVRHITVRGNFLHSSPGAFRVTGDSTSTSTICDLDGDGTLTYSTGPSAGEPDDSWETRHHPNGDHDNDTIINSADADHIALGTFTFPAGEFYTIEHNIAVNIMGEHTESLQQGDKLDDFLFAHNTVELADEFWRGIDFNSNPRFTPNVNCDWVDENGDGAMNGIDEDCEPMDDSAVYDNLFVQHQPSDGDGDGNDNVETQVRCDVSSGDAAITNCFTNPIASAFYNNVLYAEDGTLSGHATILTVNYLADLDIDGDNTADLSNMRFAFDGDDDYEPLDWRLCQGAADPIAGCVGVSPYAAGQAEDASDDTDVGANATAVDCFTAGVVAGAPTGTWASCFEGFVPPDPPAASPGPFRLDGLSLSGLTFD